MAQQPSQQEPTMEEILASIRRIISEDADESAKEPEAQAQPEPVQARHEPAPQPVEEDEDVLELDQVVEPEEEPQMSAPEPEPPPSQPKPQVQAKAEPPRRRAPEPVPAPDEEDLMLVDDDAPRGGLLSQNAANAISNAFGQLHTRTRVSDSPGTTLEDIVREMLQPMLQEWLETNLPAITERLVQEEIERVSRASRRR